MKRLMSFLICIVVAFTFVGGFIGDGIAIEADAAVYNLPYYYYQLTEKEKGYYKLMKKAILDQKSTLTIKAKISEDTLSKLIDLLYYNDVQIFNLKTAGAEMASSYTKLEFSYIYTKESADKMAAAVEKKANAVISTFTEDTKIYTKIKTIHDYIVNNTEYDLDAKFASTAYGALVKGKAKCDGYSHAFAYICSRAGIRTVNVAGNAGEDHMWNKVYYNKKWYNIDVTWDDPDSPLKDNSSYNYFMIEDSVLGKTHTEFDCEFNIPAATDTTKSYYDVYKLTASDTATAKSLLISGIAKAADKKGTSAAIQFETAEAMNNAIAQFNKNDGAMLYEILDAANEKSKNEIKTYAYRIYRNDNTYTFSIYFFYPNTNLSFYYNDTSQIDSATRDFLKKIGISA